MEVSLNQYTIVNERTGNLNAQTTGHNSEVAPQVVAASRTIGTTELSNYDVADANSMVSPGFK